MGWAMGQPFSLDFRAFETVTLFLSVTLVSIVVQDGRSNWLKGESAREEGGACKHCERSPWSLNGATAPLTHV